MSAELGDTKRWKQATNAARVEGDPTAFLLADHDWLRSVFIEIEQALLDGDHFRVSPADLAELCNSILAHMRREDEVYLPGVKRLVSEEGRTWVATAGPEHEVLQGYLDDFAEAAASAGDIRAAFHHLKREMLWHFDNEERFIFDGAKRNLSREEKQHIMQRMDEVK